MKHVVILAIGVMAGSLAGQVLYQVNTPPVDEMVKAVRVGIYAWILFKLIELNREMAK